MRRVSSLCHCGVCLLWNIEAVCLSAHRPHIVQRLLLLCDVVSSVTLSDCYDSRSPTEGKKKITLGRQHFKEGGSAVGGGRSGTLGVGNQFYALPSLGGLLSLPVPRDILLW